MKWKDSYWRKLSNLLPLVLVHVGCGPAIQVREFPERNPTSYLFPASLAEVKEGINLAFSKHSFRGMQLVFRQSASPVARTFLEKLGSEDDALLYNFHGPIGNSALYFFEGEPAKYLASFQLHLTPVGERQTLVDIITHKAEVIAGKTSGFLSPHGPANIYVEVSPTSIEEYEILLRLSQTLKVGDMPPLRLPR